MLLAYFRQIREQAKKEGYAFIFETCNLQRGDRLNRFLAGEEEDDDSIKVEGPFEQDSLYVTYDDFYSSQKAFKVDSPEDLGRFLEGAEYPAIAERFVIVSRKSGKLISYSEPFPGSTTRNEAIRELEKAWNELSSNEKDDLVLELACIATNEQWGVMDNRNDYFYDFAADEFETIHSYTPIAAISLATTEKVMLDPES